MSVAVKFGPQQLPAGWSIKSIGNVLNVVERPVKMVSDQQYRRVTVKRRHGGIEFRDVQFGADIKVKNQYLVKAGDFLISERQIVHGACGIVPTSFDGALVSNEYLVLEPRAGFGVCYFNYLVQLQKYARLFLLCSQGVDIEKFLFKPKDWLKKEIPVPSFPEQQKISAILTTVDDKLDVISRQIDATQTLKQGLMQTLFSRGVGSQDAAGRWAPHTEFKDSELGKVPEAWVISSIGNVCDVKGGKRLPKGESLTNENTGFPYIRVTDMYMGGVNTKSILYVPTHIQPSIARYTISKDDIFITVAGTLGLVGVVPDELDGANLTENADKLTDIKIVRDYLLYCLCSEVIQDAIAREATSNAQPKLALTRIREFIFPLPPESEQVRIAEILKAVDEKLNLLSKKQLSYESLKRGLMQKLLTGEWRVTLDMHQEFAFAA